MLTSDKSAIPTLIFDEVDVGISGATASVVGKLLRKLGQRCQVLCITHLPQVACQGHQHFSVENTLLTKNRNQNDRTFAGTTRKSIS